VVLDTETTGLEVAQGHRIIELGCVEVINRRLTGRRFHQYVNPEREIDPGAIEVHGISNEFLDDKPAFLRVAEAFLDFIEARSSSSTTPPSISASSTASCGA
jgi:DNA polymerase-3 subunit epsilon